MRRLAIARALFAIFGAVTLVGLVVFATTVLASPTTDGGRSYHYARSGDDYIVYTVPLVPSDHLVFGSWMVSVGNRSPDGMMVVPAEEIRDVLAGKAPAHLLRTANRTVSNDWSFMGRTSGSLSLELLTPAYERPYACPDCRDDPRPTIVWFRGSAWTGANESALQNGLWGLDAEGRPTGDAPILFKAVSEEHNFVEWYEPLYFGLAATAGLTILAGLWWAVEARLALRVAPRPAPPSTEDMLRVVELSERYLVSLSRAFLASGAALVLMIVVVMWAIVPTLMAAARRHAIDPFTTNVPILLMGPFVAMVAAVLWAAGYRRIRRERDRWRGLSGEFAETTRRILE